jgi:hypothetical protein
MEDNWLSQEDFDKLTQQLNNIQPSAKTWDENWSKLKFEKQSHVIPDPVLKTKTPTLMLFDSGGVAFNYRVFDGASWHTQLCVVDTEMHKTGFTSEQRRFVDNYMTIVALKQLPTPKWITPERKDTFALDSQYQLMQCVDSWFCMIGTEIYEESNRRQQPGREYTEVTFSTRNKPLIDLQTTEKILDKII